jgi:hypothetical protein
VDLRPDDDGELRPLESQLYDAVPLRWPNLAFDRS